MLVFNEVQNELAVEVDNFLWNRADDEQDIPVVAAELRPGEIHLHGQPRVVDVELGGEGDLVVLVRRVLHPYLRWGEGNHLAGRGDTGVQGGRGEGLVPGAGGDQLRVLVALRGLEVAEGAAGEENLRGEDELTVPLPGTAGRALGGLRAVHS